MARRSAGSAGMSRSLGCACGEVAFGRGKDSARICFLGVLPRLDEPLGEVAAGLHEERARTHRHVADFEREDFLRRFELPFLLRLALGRADIDERLQRVLDDGFGEDWRRVVRAGAAAVGARGDVDAALGNDDELAEAVLAEQAGEGLDALASRGSWPQAMRSLCSSTQLRGFVRARLLQGRFASGPVSSLQERRSSSSCAFSRCSVLRVSRAGFPVPCLACLRGRARLRARASRCGRAGLRRRGRSARRRARGTRAGAPPRSAAGNFHRSTCKASSRCSTTRLLIGSGSAGDRLPVRARGAAFEERDSGRDRRASRRRLAAAGLVLDAAVDGAEGGEQPAPGIVAALQDFFAVLVGTFSQQFAEAWRRRSAGRRAARRAGAGRVPPRRRGRRAASSR